MVQRTIAYVDGFNLYHGMRDVAGRRYHWLDLELLGQQLARGRPLQKIRYFTARVRNNQPSEQRQDTYLQALAAHCTTVEITEGRFQKQNRRCRSCTAQWITYEEKESDVNIAIALVEDAALGNFDTALLISGDSDLNPAVKAAKRLRDRAQAVVLAYETGLVTPGEPGRRLLGPLPQVDQ